MAHRWSSWPGAYCLDCGCWDVEEQAIAQGMNLEGNADWVLGKLKQRFPNHPALAPCPNATASDDACSKSAELREGLSEENAT